MGLQRGGRHRAGVPLVPGRARMGEKAALWVLTHLLTSQSQCLGKEL